MGRVPVAAPGLVWVVAVFSPLMSTNWPRLPLDRRWSDAALATSSPMVLGWGLVPPTLLVSAGAMASRTDWPSAAASIAAFAALTSSVADLMASTSPDSMTSLSLALAACSFSVRVMVRPPMR